MKGFKKFGAEEISDLGEYARDYLRKHKEDLQNIKILVGCDAEEHTKYWHYGTVVMFYHEGKGAHYVHRKNDFVQRPAKRKTLPEEIFQKIWGEVERVHEVCEYLEKELDGHLPRRDPNKKLVEAHVDINSDPAEKSHIVYSAATGFFRGANYEVKTKPHAWAASCAADLVSRK